MIGGGVGGGGGGGSEKGLSPSKCAMLESLLTLVQGWIQDFWKGGSYI